MYLMFALINVFSAFFSAFVAGFNFAKEDVRGTTRMLFWTTANIASAIMLGTMYVRQFN